MRKNNFKKSVLLITLLSLCLAAISCNQATGPSVTNGSATDTSHVETTDNLLTEANTDEITIETDTDSKLQLSLPHDVSLDVLNYMVWAEEIPYDEVVFYPAFQDAVAKEFSKYTSKPVTWENLNYSAELFFDKQKNIYHFWYQDTLSYITYISCGIDKEYQPDGSALYILRWNKCPQYIYGPYSVGDKLISDPADFSTVDGSCFINHNALVAVLDSHIDLSKYKIQYSGIQLSAGMISVPLLCGNQRFYAEIEIDTSMNYVFRSFYEDGIMTNDDLILMFEKIFGAEMKICDYVGNESLNKTFDYLGDCLINGTAVSELETSYAYIDFDGDGLTEAIIYDAYGQYILHYDTEDGIVYAIFFTFRRWYVYYANGEIGLNREDDMTRYRITSFDGTCANISEVTYTDTEPNKEMLTFTKIDIEHSFNEFDYYEQQQNRHLE